MVAKRSGLGRNLSALLQTNSLLDTSNTASGSSMNIVLINIDCLKPGAYQPRRDISEAKLIELSQSIQQHGLLQPIIAREITPGVYEIIAGERRWRASQMAGLSQVPVSIRAVNHETAMALALIENLQRDDLNAIEQALAMQRLLNEFSLTHQQIANILSQSRASVSNHLRLLQLQADVQDLLQRGLLDMGHARCLLMLDNEEQKHVAQLVINKQLSVRETEKLVARLKANKEIRPEISETYNFYNKQLDTLRSHLQTKVTLKQGKNGQGSLVIQFHNPDHLDQMVARFLME
jgi:ParB family chromosome partitioning protein